MLKLCGKYLGIREIKVKNDKKAYQVGIQDGFNVNLVGIKQEHLERFRGIKEGEELEVKVYAISWANNNGKHGINYYYNPN